MKNGTWCEPIILKVIASMWACRITVIHADNFYQTRIRHKGDPFNADIALVFNTSYHHAHYITSVRTNGKNFILGIPEKDDGYDRSVIHADNFYQTRIRHKGDPFNAAIALVFNASYHHAYYITTVRTNGKYFILGIPEKDDGYDRSVDRVERVKRKDFDWKEEGEQELVVIPMDVCKMMVYKCDQYDKMVQLAKKTNTRDGQRTRTKIT